MATPFTTIYKKFLNQVEDNEFILANELTILELLNNYLINSIVDFSDCKTPLDYKGCESGDFYIEPTIETEYVFTKCLGRDIEFSIVDENEKTLELGVDYEVEELVNEEDNIVEIKLIFKTQIESKLYVKWRFEGEFLYKLTNEEIYILSLGMTLHWVRAKSNREDNLKQFISDKDFKQLSNANMLNRLMAYERTTRNLLKEYKSTYHFRGFEGWN